jgi:hypothetical protein
MTIRDDDLRIRPGRIHHGNRGAKRPRTFVGEVMRAAKKAGRRRQRLLLMLDEFPALGRLALERVTEMVARSAPRRTELRRGAQSIALRCHWTSAGRRRHHIRRCGL